MLRENPADEENTSTQADKPDEPPKKKQKKCRSPQTTKTHKKEMERLHKIWLIEEREMLDSRSISYKKLEKKLLHDVEFYILQENGKDTEYMKCGHPDCSENWMQQHFSNKNLKKSTAETHAKHNHANAEFIRTDGSGSDNHGRRRNFTNEVKQKIAEELSQWVVKLGIPIKTLERQETKDMFQFIVCDIMGYSRSTFDQFPLSRYAVYKCLEKSHADLKSIIQERGRALAEDGRLFLMNDHWHSRKSSYELSNKYHGVLLGLRKEDGSAVTYLLRFSPAELATQQQIKHETVETLHDYGLLSAYSDKLIPIVSDGAIAWGKETDLHVVCMPHSLSRIK